MRLRALLTRDRHRLFVLEKDSIRRGPDQPERPPHDQLPEHVALRIHDTAVRVERRRLIRACNRWGLGDVRDLGEERGAALATKKGATGREQMAPLNRFAFGLLRLLVLWEWA